MQETYFEQLKKLLTSLKNNPGHFIIQNGSMSGDGVGGDGYYCQFSKNSAENLIHFEAVSHHFDNYLNKNLKPKFTALGFSLEKGENYAKNILLNSKKDVENIANEIAEIFEEIYKVNERSVYDFDNQIEIGYERSKERKTESINTVLQREKQLTSTKISGFVWLLVIGLAIVGYALFTDSKKSSSSNEIVHNSGWDGSVQQVVDYLKNSYLNDPDSYKPVEWSNVFKLNDVKQIGFPSYQVRHKYRAKNAFGGYVTEEKLFKLDYQGNIVEMKDWIK